MTLLEIWNINLTDYEKGGYGAIGGHKFIPHYKLNKYFRNEDDPSIVKTELAFNELAISVINAIYANKPILNTLNAKTKDTNNEIILKSFTIENIRRAIKKEISTRNLNGTFFEMTKQEEINTPNFSQSISRTTWFTTKNQLSDETWNYLQNSFIDKYELNVETKQVRFTGMDGTVSGHNIERVITHEILYDKLKDHFFGINGISVNLKDNNDPSKGLEIIYEPIEDPDLPNFIQSSLKEKRIDLEEVLKPNLQDGIKFKYDPINKNYIISHNFNDNQLLKTELNRIIALIPTSINAYTKSEIDGKIKTINGRFTNNQHRLDDLYKLFPNNVQIHSDFTSIEIQDKHFASYNHNSPDKSLYQVIMTEFTNFSHKDKLINYRDIYKMFFLEARLDIKTLLNIYLRKMVNSSELPFNLNSPVLLTGEFRMLILYNSGQRSYDFIIQMRQSNFHIWNSEKIYRIAYLIPFNRFTDYELLDKQSIIYDIWQAFDRRLALDEKDFFTSYNAANFPVFTTLKEKFNEPLNGETTEIVDIAGNTKKLHDWFIEEYIWHDIREEYKVNGTVLVVSSKNNASTINRPAGEANKWLGAIGLDNKEVDTTAEGDGGIQWNTNEATLSTGYYDVEYLDIIYDDRVIGLKGVKIDIVKPDGTPAVLGVDYKVGFKYRGRHYTWTSMQTSETREFFCGGKVLALKPIKLQFKIRFASNTERGSGTGHNQAEVKIERQKWVVIVKKGTGTEPENIGNESRK